MNRTTRKTKHAKRPLQVRYYRLAGTMPDYPDRYGHPASNVGVVRGAIVRLMLGEFECARVYDTKTGFMTMSLHAREGKLPEVRYGGQRLGVAQRDGTIRYGTK